MRFTHRVAILGLLCWLLSASNDADARGPITDDPDSMFNEAAEDIGFRYQTEFTGVAEEQLLELLESASRLIALADQPPPTLSALERMVRAGIRSPQVDRS